MNRLSSEVLAWSVVAVFDDDDDRVLKISFVSSVLRLVVALPMFLFDFPVVNECANLLRRRKYCFSLPINGKSEGVSSSCHEMIFTRYLLVLLVVRVDAHCSSVV